MITYPMPRFEQQKAEVAQRYQILNGSASFHTNHVAQTAALTFGVPMVVAALNERYRGWFRSSFGMNDHQHEVLQRFCAHASLSMGPFVVEDARNEEYFSRRKAVQYDPNVVFFAGSPLCNPDGLRFGTLCLIDHQPRTLNAVQRSTLDSFAALLSSEICVRSAARYAVRDLIEAEEDKCTLYDLAMTDSLTGALNRRAFFRFTGRELSRVQRHQLNMSVLMMDVDHFKKVNDVHGHQAGDDVLKALVKVISENMRDEDLIGRLGGEEFALVIPETDPSSAAIFAERIREKIKRLRFKGDGGEFGITLSIGISEPTLNDRDLDPALERADKALYDAKNGGRDQVIVAPQPWPQRLSA